MPRLSLHPNQARLAPLLESRMPSARAHDPQQPPPSSALPRIYQLTRPVTLARSLGHRQTPNGQCHSVASACQASNRPPMAGAGAAGPGKPRSSQQRSAYRCAARRLRAHVPLCSATKAADCTGGHGTCAARQAKRLQIPSPRGPSRHQGHPLCSPDEVAFQRWVNLAVACRYPPT